MKVYIPVIVACGTNAKNLKVTGKLHVFFVSNGTNRFKILENDWGKTITCAADLKKMFPDIGIHML